MKTAAEWEEDIANITLKIHNEFPELSKYIDEMPDSFTRDDNDEIATKNFKEYYNSLEELISEYKRTHDAK
jgi:hypothetical protein